MVDDGSCPMTDYSTDPGHSPETVEIPLALVGLLLLSAAGLAILFLTAAQVVQTP